MPYDAFLSIEGIEGETTAKGFEGQIKLDSFSLGAHNETSIGEGAGGGAGKVSVSNFNVTKSTDAASPLLFQACCKGQHFPNATVTMRKAGGDQMVFLEYKFDTVYVEDLQWSGAAGGDEVPMESMSLAFGKVEVTYTKQNPDGSPGGSTVGRWDLMAVSAD